MMAADRFSRGLTDRQLKAIRSHDRPEADADLPSCDEIASMSIADIEGIAIKARRRLQNVVPHVRFLRSQAIRAAAVVAALESAVRMADPHLVCEEDRSSDGRDIDPFGVLGEEMFINIELALEQANGWVARDDRLRRWPLRNFRSPVDSWCRPMPIGSSSRPTDCKR